MKSINQIFLSLPNLKKQSHHKKKIFVDFIFFIVVAAVQSSFFALVDQHLFYKPGSYDLNLFFIVFSFIYMVLYFKHLPKVLDIPGGKAFFLLTVFIAFQLFYSYFFQGIPIKEILTIYRKNFFGPISALGLLLYASTMDRYRIERFFRWLLIATFLQSALYVFSNITGIKVFGASVKNVIQYQDVVLMQNVFAISHFLPVLFIFSLITSFTDNNYKKNWLWVTALIVVVLSFVRSMLLVYIMYIILFLVIGKFSRLNINFPKYIKQIFIMTFAVFLLFVIFPKHVDRLIYKFGFRSKHENQYSINSVKMSTYNFRIDLIKEAYKRTKSNIILGNGYIRESRIGGYDFVLGGDTKIAPVLYTEGLAGIVFRWFPIFVILFVNLKNLIMNNNKYSLYPIAITILILPEFINVVQTNIFVKYERIFIILMMLQLIIIKDKQNDREINVP